jgi:uncharacterized protein (TIGR00255 family)
MVASMTGYGRGEATAEGITVAVELRTVNSRFLEVSSRMPRSLALRENDIKEIVRKRISRGKVNLQVMMDKKGNGDLPVSVDLAAAKAYHRLLNDLRKKLKIREQVKLEHILQFSEILSPAVEEKTDELEWSVTQQALQKALDGLETMRQNEGRELERDFRERISVLEKQLENAEELSKTQVPAERMRLRERIKQIIENTTVDEGRLEMELAILAERLDVTEECVRFRSHNKFFLEALSSNEPAGRKLNFLIQEMNREVNTIGSKSNATDIAHIVVSMKEEMEKIREQLQNIE